MIQKFFSKSSSKCGTQVPSLLWSPHQLMSTWDTTGADPRLLGLINKRRELYFLWSLDSLKGKPITMLLKGMLWRDLKIRN